MCGVLAAGTLQQQQLLAEPGPQVDPHLARPRAAPAPPSPCCAWVGAAPPWSPPSSASCCACPAPVACTGACCGGAPASLRASCPRGTPTVRRACCEPLSVERAQYARNVLQPPPHALMRGSLSSSGTGLQRRASAKLGPASQGAHSMRSHRPAAPLRSSHGTSASTGASAATIRMRSALMNSPSAAPACAARARRPLAAAERPAAVWLWRALLPPPPLALSSPPCACSMRPCRPPAGRTFRRAPPPPAAPAALPAGLGWLLGLAGRAPGCAYGPLQALLLPPGWPSPWPSGACHSSVGHAPWPLGP